MMKKENGSIFLYSETAFPHFLGGGEVFLHKFSAFLSTKGFKPIIITNKIHEKEKDAEKRDGYNVLRVKPVVKPPSMYGWPKNPILKFFLQIKKILREISKIMLFYSLTKRLKTKIIILNGVTVTVLPSFIPLATRMKAWRILRKISREKPKVVLIVHAVNPPKGLTLKNALDDIREADVVIAVDKWIKEFLKNKVNKKIHYIANGVDVAEFKPVKEPGKDYAILFVGRLSHDHSLDTLLKALAILKGKRKEVNLMVVGDGPLKNFYKEMTEKLSISRNVYFMGGIPNSEMPEIYNSSYIVVNPIRVTGIGISTLEAMSCGRAVIKASKTMKDDVIIDGYNGLLFRTNNHNELAERIEFALENPKKIKRMGERARTMVLEKYSLTTTFNKYLEALNQVRKGNR